jgi:hypothetical protein
MTDQCRCPDSNHAPPVIGTSLGNGVVARWASLPDTPGKNKTGPLSHELAQCACGCNTYSESLSAGPVDFDALDIPVLPIQLDYVDDDEPSDDHEYVSIKATEYAQLLSKVRSAEGTQSAN